MFFELNQSFWAFYVAYVEFIALPAMLLVVAAVAWAIVETTPPKPVIVENTVQR